MKNLSIYISLIFSLVFLSACGNKSLSLEDSFNYSYEESSGRINYFIGNEDLILLNWELKPFIFRYFRKNTLVLSIYISENILKDSCCNCYFSKLGFFSRKVNFPLYQLINLNDEIVITYIDKLFLGRRYSYKMTLSSVEDLYLFESSHVYFEYIK